MSKMKTGYEMVCRIVPKFVILSCLSIYSVLAFAVPASYKSAQLNVLFITIDDLNTDLGSYGHPIVQSPNIDALAQKGVRFDRAYSQYPVCTPSRSSFLTGRYPEELGVLNNKTHFRDNAPDIITLPQLFRDAGYSTARTGKIFHYNVPEHIGTDGADDPLAWDRKINPRGDERDLEKSVNSVNPQTKTGATLTWLTTDLSEERFTDSLVADAAISLLEDSHPDKTGKPFFVAAGFFLPHAPFIAPADYFDKYPVDILTTISGVEQDRKDIPVYALHDRPGQLGMSEDIQKQVIQAYYASITFVDRQVGKVLEALERLGLHETTMIVLMSDHGFHLGAHGLWQKSDLFEGSARAPMIIYLPGIKSNGEAVSTPVEMIDIYSTVAEAAGLQVPKGTQGESLVPFLHGDALVEKRSAYTMTLSRAWQTRPGVLPNNLKGYSIRTERYRYTEWGENGAFGKELYDYDTDPEEIENLAANPDSEVVVERLTRLLRERRRYLKKLH